MKEVNDMAKREEALALLYSNLGRRKDSTPSDVQSLIEFYLDAASARLKKDGLDVSADNYALTELWVMYSAYLYRHRDSERPMPPSLRCAINDAKVAAATEVAE